MRRICKFVSIILCIAVFITSLGISGGSFSVHAESPTYTGLVITKSGVIVRLEANSKAQYLGAIPKNTTINLYGEAIDTGDGKKWYKTLYNNQFGYVCAYNANDTDGATYITNITALPKPPEYNYDADFETNLTNQRFPESYKVLLRQLHAAHPDWVFLADHLTMSFDTAVDNEAVGGKALVSSGSKASWKSMKKDDYNWGDNSYVVYDSGGWVAAEREVIEYYMEPRNFLNDDGIFLFLDQTYNPSVQNKEGLQKILNGTFMEGAFPESTYATWADVIMDAATKSGVSPYVLASMILIEQGSNGSGASISGTNPGYEGYYNFFNINAYAKNGLTAVANGLKYAMGNSSYGRPWNTRAKSIIGGAQYFANGYVKRGQDTLYYKKFNVITPSFYNNQYMTNVQGAYHEAQRNANAYKGSTGALTFSIPVYQNTSETNKTYLPTSSGANNYYLTALSVNGAPVEGFDMYKNDYEMVVYSSQVNVTASVPSGASVSGTGMKTLSPGANTVTLTVTAASGKTANYTISIYRQGGGDGSSAPSINTSYNIGTYITGIKVGTDVNTFISNLGVSGGTARVITKDNAAKTSGAMATGDKVIVSDTSGAQRFWFTVVIYGDSNGDGKISIVDLGRVKKHLLDMSYLSGAQFTAADTNRDGKLSIVDLGQHKKHMLEIASIAQ